FRVGDAVAVAVAELVAVGEVAPADGAGPISTTGPRSLVTPVSRTGLVPTLRIRAMSGNVSPGMYRCWDELGYAIWRSRSAIVPSGLFALTPGMDGRCADVCVSCPAPQPDNSPASTATANTPARPLVERVTCGPPKSWGLAAVQPNLR